MNPVTNTVLAGLGGQGVLWATDILAAVALAAGYDVKKNEIKGMSQRGGSVTGDVRFGDHVFSPMVPTGEADYLVVLEPTQVEPHRHLLRPAGVLITPAEIDATTVPHKKAMNVALLGALSTHLPFSEELWLSSFRASFEESFFSPNKAAFLIGRTNQTTITTAIEDVKETGWWRCSKAWPIGKPTRYR
jgi:indolepyruvate ferredoxin oxidoreductase beta subunit